MEQVKAGRAIVDVLLVVYPISDEAAFVSGAEIVVDGGQTAHWGAKSISDAWREDLG
jgi:3alpha(or 20beta)-hydroxysteroid dehydrogenase